MNHLIGYAAGAVVIGLISATYIARLFDHVQQAFTLAGVQ